MRILVDANACPVKQIIVRMAKRNQIPVIMLIDTSHRINDGYSQVITVDKEADSVDYALIAAPEGTGVAAAAGGRVVFAGPLIVSGNAVIIDHGMWLYTSYYHLSAIDVTVGDGVTAGDIIGKVGSTGYSTGPHLHYAATVKLSPVNPDMLKAENPLEFNS